MTWHFICLWRLAQLIWNTWDATTRSQTSTQKFKSPVRSGLYSVVIYALLLTLILSLQTTHSSTSLQQRRFLLKSVSVTRRGTAAWTRSNQGLLMLNRNIRNCCPVRKNQSVHRLKNSTNSGERECSRHWSVTPRALWWLLFMRNVGNRNQTMARSSFTTPQTGVR